MKKIVKTAVIAIGGQGSRMAPITTVIPKQLVPIIDKPVIQYVLEEVVSTKISRIIFVGFRNRKTRLIIDYLKNSNQESLKELFKRIKVNIVYVGSNTLGDAIPIRAVKRYIKNEPFLVLWSDSFALAKDLRMHKLIEVYNKYQEPVISLLKIGKRETDLYAIARIKKIDSKVVVVEELLEKPGPRLAPSEYAAPNGFILDNRIFPYINKLKANNKGISVIDAINKYCKKNVVYGSIFNKPFFEAGNKLDVLISNIRLPLIRKDLKNIASKVKEYLKAY